MQQQKCYIPGCQNQSLTHGLCLEHTRIPDNQLHPTSGIRKDVTVTMAGRFFNSLSVKQSVEEFLEQVLPVVRVPFIPDENTFHFHNYQGHPDDDEFKITPTEPLRLRDELVKGIHEPNVVNRPIVFLVVTNIPHTSLYILYGGQFYSVGFGVHRLDDGSRCGTLYSIDIPLTQFSEARIVWIGILTDAMVTRLQEEFDRVTNIVGNFKKADVVGQPLIVERLMFFHTPTRVYGADPDEWNCTKWAMHVLFGDRMPANFRELVSRTNPGLTKDQLTRWLTAYGGRDQAEFKRVLHEINHAIFPRGSMGGTRRRMTNNGNRNRNGMKRKTRKLRKHSV